MRLRRGSMLLRSGSSGSMLLRSGSSGSMLLRSGSKFKVKPKGLTRRRLYTRHRRFTRSSAALHAEGFTRAVGALPAPQVLYTRFSALNA